MKPAFVGTPLHSVKPTSVSRVRVKAVSDVGRPCRARGVHRLASLRMASESMNTRIDEAIKNAEDAARKFGKGSKEAKVAWDVVEELEAERSHQAAQKKSEDPLEQYCKEVPEADECRVYED